MPESIVLQIGQCGNQIGTRFWDLALKEHIFAKKSNALFAEEAHSSFFYRAKVLEAPKARSILIDMEENVINQIIKGPLSKVFDSTRLIYDVSGSGNNWAVGHKIYGPQYHDSILHLLRKESERCNSLQCFFLLHSLGGGTGSGLGTYILKLLTDEYPEVNKFVVAIFPSQDDDVITSPYNAILALHHLIEYADCIFPIDNQSLINICNSHNKIVTLHKRHNLTLGSTSNLKREKPYDQMNNIVANMLLHMTSSARFGGSLNVDLQEIVTNLVPFPKLHFLLSSMAPLSVDTSPELPQRKLEALFSDLFSSSHHLVTAEPRSHTYLACSILARGNITVSDLHRNLASIESGLRFATFNQDKWKLGLCDVPPPGGQSQALLTLANNTAIAHLLTRIQREFSCMFSRKAHLHHFLEVPSIEIQDFKTSQNTLWNVIDEYNKCNSLSTPHTPLPRLRIAF